MAERDAAQPAAIPIMVTRAANTAVDVDSTGATLRVADESDLCRLWAARAFGPGSLVTTDGRALQVIYPGRRTGGGGPDFHDAILADDAGRAHAGDVEVHLRARDWLAHGHRADPAYNRVVLHVVLEDDGSPCLRADGVPVPVLALGSLLTESLTASPELPRYQPCRVAPALPTDTVRAIVRRAGRARLDGKAVALEAQIEAIGPEQVLFSALLDAAGYSRNRAPCLALAERAPIERLHDLLSGKETGRAMRIATAVLLGLAGFLPGDDDRLTATWTEYGDMWSLTPLRADDWVRAGVRPANHPELRLRGMATLVVRSVRAGLADLLLSPLRRGDADALVARLAVQAAAAISPSMDDGASRDGEVKGAMRQNQKTPPIGHSRAVEMAINAVVPFALALARSTGDAALEEGAWRIAAELPSGEDTEPRRAMLSLLTGCGHRLRALSALDNQGLLRLYYAHCGIHACWDCPLATGAS